MQYRGNFYAALSALNAVVDHAFLGLVAAIAATVALGW
jgi:hypothetical protein